MLVTNNYDNMRNTNKTVFHIPKIRTDRYLFQNQTISPIISVRPRNICKTKITPLFSMNNHMH